MTQHPSSNSVFVRACRGESVPYTPLWFMRQAGRYMAEYREMRAKVSFLELCNDADLMAETARFAAERVHVDAAILFSDLLLILMPMGLGLEYTKGKGPQLSGVVRTAEDVERIRVADPATDLGYVFEGVKATRAALPDDLPLIGFSGCPFTLASYACEGGGSKNYLHTKTLMYRDPDAWHALMGKLVDSLIPYLAGQAEAGAQVLQVFDSWIGAVGPQDYVTYVKPHSQRMIAGIKALHPDVPLIHFGTGSCSLLEEMQDAGGDVIGIDFQTSFADGRRRLGDDQPVQGNLDPVALMADWDDLKKMVQRVLDQNAGRPGHIFNLGHGILPPTPVDNVRRVSDYVHEQTAR